MTSTVAGKTRRQPGRGRPANPAGPRAQNRARHLRAVSTQMPSRRAIAALGDLSTALTPVTNAAGPAPAASTPARAVGAATTTGTGIQR